MRHQRRRTMVPAVLSGLAMLTAAPAAAWTASTAADRRPSARPGATAAAVPLQSADTAEQAEQPELVRGVVGPPVTAWQEQLNMWRSRTGQTPIAVDGIYGSVTEAATRNFQATSGLATDGVVGALTRAAMDGALEAPAPAPAPEVPPGSEPLLDRGTAGPAVGDWQSRLNEWRTRTGLAAIAVDGIYGPITDNATRNFQAAADIAVDGIVGPQTRSALEEALAAPAPAPAADAPVIGPGSAGLVVAAWQQQVNEWRTRTGLAAIAVDGIYGPVTEAATTGFQQEAGITVDGVAGPETRAALGAALR